MHNHANIRVAREATVSLLWALPIMRVTGTSPSDVLHLLGVELKDFVSPDTRVRHSLMMRLLGIAVRRSRDPALGLRAGAKVEPGDFEPLEYAYRSCRNLRDATHFAGRFLHLMHGAHEACLREHGELATWELRMTDDVEQLPAANDLTLASICSLARRYTGKRGTLKEVHFMHAEATDRSAYARVFDGATIRLGMPHNALVFARSHLDSPMSLAHAGLRAAYELRATQILDRMQRSASTALRVRQVIIDSVAEGDVNLRSTADRLGMNVAMLRRRLAEEGCSHSQILAQVRRELASDYLRDRNLPIGEVASLLGFSHVPAFYKAFGRWSLGAATPAEFRALARAGAAIAAPR